MFRFWKGGILDNWVCETKYFETHGRSMTKSARKMNLLMMKEGKSARIHHKKIVRLRNDIRRQQNENS